MQARCWSQYALGQSMLGAIAAALIAVSPVARAADGPQDYRFEVINQPVAVGAHSEFNVKLTKTSTGEAVSEATFTRSRLEMTMLHTAHKPGTPPMTTTMAGEVKTLGSPTPGVYRLMGDVSMPGTWKVEIVAAVPGEEEPVEGTATFKAGK